MTAEELQRWLEKHADDIIYFMDYEPTIESEDELAETLRYWFDDDDWNDGQRFVHLGIDGTGSQFAAWIRPDVEGRPPVVFFGSEGSTGVLARSPADFAMALSHGPGIDEYAGDYAVFDPESNWLLDEDQDEEELQEARDALASYRADAERRFGSIPTLDELTDDLEALNEEFADWVSDRFESDDEDDED